MGNVIQLNQVRKAKKADFLKKHRQRIDAFIHSFLEKNVAFDFNQIAASYQDVQAANFSESWDYQDFRELLRDAIWGQISVTIMEEMKKQHWFDPRYCSAETVSEKCLSFLILGRGRIANE